MTRAAGVALLAAIAVALVAGGVLLVLAEITRLRRVSELDAARAESEGFAHGLAVGTRQIGVERAGGLELVQDAALEQAPGTSPDEAPTVDSAGPVDDEPTPARPSRRRSGVGVLVGGDPGGLGLVVVDRDQLIDTVDELARLAARADRIAQDMRRVACELEIAGLADEPATP